MSNSSSNGMTHELKCAAEFFEAVRDGRKPFEVRVADRPFKLDDVLHLREVDLLLNYTGRECRKRVIYILRGWGVEKGHVCMGLTDIGAHETSGNRSVTLNGYQLKAALEFVAPDMDADQLETEVSIQWGDEKVGHSGVGYYCCLTEYPEEGSILLNDKPEDSAKETVGDTWKCSNSHIRGSDPDCKVCFPENGKALQAKGE